jgi:hypothetical protein
LLDVPDERDRSLASLSLHLIEEIYDFPFILAVRGPYSGVIVCPYIISQLCPGETISVLQHPLRRRSSGPPAPSCSMIV